MLSPQRKPRIVVALFIAATLTAQSVPEFDQALHVSTQEVLLDLVVRDKHQKLVTDLRPDEIQIYEDGVPQHVTSFRFRRGTPQELELQSNPTTNHYDPLRELNLVSIVFEGMSAESRQRATQYALDFLKEGVGPNTWMGVFTLTTYVSVVQPYTKDLDLLRSAVRRAATGQYETFAKESEVLLNRMNSLQAAVKGSAAAQYQPLSPGAADDIGPSTGIAGGPANAAEVLLAVQRAMLRSLYESAGARSIDSLRQLIRAQSQLPGRKTVLLVCEGVVVPPEKPELLNSIISEANRANVTFYTLDARGVQMSSHNQSAQLAVSAINDNPFNGPIEMPSSLKTDVQANARALAQGTGGFALDNSNDLRGPLRRVMEDVRTHYEVTYTPQSAALDGRFRSVDVRVLRPGLMIQSRKGYYAVPLLNGQSVSLTEMAGLRALNAKPAPHSFNFQFAASDLARAPHGGQYEITFAVPASSIRFQKESNNDRFRIHVACMALVKQALTSSQPEAVVANVSKDLPYSVPANRKAEFEAGTITVSMPVTLPFGSYHIEAVMMDLQAGTASVKKIRLVASPAKVSDFIWVRSVRTHPAKATDEFNPLDTPYGTLIPEPDGAFAVAQAAAFFLRIFQSCRPQAAQMTISQDGKPVRTIALTLPPPSLDGTVSFLGKIPPELPAGQYEVELLIQSDNERISRFTELSLIAHP